MEFSIFITFFDIFWQIMGFQEGFHGPEFKGKVMRSICWNGPILPKILPFSVPLTLSTMLQLLFNAADVVVVGRYAGDNSLATV